MNREITSVLQVFETSKVVKMYREWRVSLGTGNKMAYDWTYLLELKYTLMRFTTFSKVGNFFQAVEMHNEKRDLNRWATNNPGAIPIYSADSIHVIR